MKRTGRNPRVNIEHHRDGKSEAYLWMVLEGKREDFLRADLTEGQLLDLAEEALKIAAILRRRRAERTETCPCGHDENEHVHYCASDDVPIGNCPCTAEYVRE